MPAGRRVVSEHPAAEIPVRKTFVRTRKRSLVGRVGHDRVVALAVAGILVGATAVSLSVGHPGVATGNTNGAGSAPRIAIGGDVAAAVTQTGDVATAGDDSDTAGSVEFADPGPSSTDPTDLATLGLAGVPTGDVEPLSDRPDSDATVDVEGPFTEDGTLVKPIAVDTTVRDGSALVKTYTVKGNETLAAIAARFDVSTMSIVWANNLKSMKDIRAGKVLRIPPVTGLIVKVTAGDTLEAIAARYDVNGTDIIATNGLDDATLIIGQVLVIPGAAGADLPVAEPSPAGTQSTSSPAATVRACGRRARTRAASSCGRSSVAATTSASTSTTATTRSTSPPITASTVRAAAAGTVTFAGWKNNGGGYQVWISHGSNLYTTYNHMSAITVGVGQHVARGTQVGRIGMTGDATGPHCHFEVWIGPIWDGGTRVNPLAYF